MGPELIIMMVVLLGGLLLMNTFAKKSQKKRVDEREKMLNESMVAGAWVQTFSGFFGRYVDTDGDVVVVETPSGEETYWLKAAIKGVIEPPFEAVHEEQIEGEEAVEEDADFDEFEAQFRAHADSVDAPEEEEVVEEVSETLVEDAPEDETK